MTDSSGPRLVFNFEGFRYEVFRVFGTSSGQERGPEAVRMGRSRARATELESSRQLEP